jgi:hypothetical protein
MPGLTWLNRYRLDAQPGEGGMNVVYSRFLDARSFAQGKEACT